MFRYKICIVTSYIWNGSIRDSKKDVLVRRWLVFVQKSTETWTHRHKITYTQIHELFIATHRIESILYSSLYTQWYRSQQMGSRMLYACILHYYDVRNVRIVIVDAVCENWHWHVNIFNSNLCGISLSLVNYAFKHSHNQHYLQHVRSFILIPIAHREEVDELTCVKKEEKKEW